MFRKAREEMERELQSNANDHPHGAYTNYQQFSNYSQRQAQVSETERLAAIEQSVNKTAMEQMKAYLRSGSADPSLQQDQVYIVYKFLNSPIEVLVSGMQQM